MKHKRKGLQLVILFALAVIGGLYFPHHQAYAAASAVKVAAVEYYDENIVVFNNGNTKIYYATDNEAATNKWECIPADSGRFTTIDISWVNPSSETGIVIKGDQVDTKTRVVLRKKPDKLNITIDYSNIDNLYNSNPNSSIASLVNVMTSEGTADVPIQFEDLEWRKGDNGLWKNATTLTVAQLQKFQVRGTYIQFRIMAVDDCVTVTNGSVIDFKQLRINGTQGGINTYAGLADSAFGTDYPDGTKGRRFSNVYKIKVAKQASSTAANIDGERFTAAITAGKEYKVTVKNNGVESISNWIKVTDKTVKTISLATLAKDADPSFTFDGTTTAFPEMHIQVRNYATSKFTSSKITTTDLIPQRILTGGDITSGKPDPAVTQTNSSVYVDYFGDKYITLYIPMASLDQPYEYCIVKNGDTFDVAHASWTLVTKNSGVKILSSKALQASTIYVRQKEIKYRAATSTSNAVSYQLASTYRKAVINYPSIPVISAANLSYVKGYTTSLTIDVQLAASNNFEDTVSSVKLGTQDILLSQNTTGTTLTLTLDCNLISQMSNCTNRVLTITFAKGTVNNTSVKLTIKNPTPAGQLSISSAAGSTVGTTKLTMVGSPAVGDKLVYVFGDAAESGKNIEDILTGVTPYNFTSGADITVDATKKYITVYEVNSTTNNIIKYKSIELTTSNVKQP